jgi:hypothetical protein
LRVRWRFGAAGCFCDIETSRLIVEMIRKRVHGTRPGGGASAGCEAAASSRLIAQASNAVGIVRENFN